MRGEDRSGVPYADPSLDVSKRVEDLLGRMTLDEKLAQLGCVWSTELIDPDGFSPAKARECLAHGTGHVTRVSGSTGLRPNGVAAFVNAIQRWLVEETRLGIPAIVHEESTAGLLARDATQFPQAIGLAATWEPALLEAVGRVIREQMLAVGARHTLAPVLDVARDPRWGRTEETYGEDPYLVSRLGVAYVRGVQGPDLARGAVATGKHFLGYGLSEGGLNHAPAHIGARELREVYARPFEAAIREAGLASVMNAYNEIDGLPCGASKEILDDLLRGELGFRGVVVADYFTTRLLEVFHRVAADRGDAGQRALEAGIDVELPRLECYGAPLRERIASGQMPIEPVDRSVRRLLRMKFELGLFERPYVDETAAARVYDTPEQRALARSVAQRSIVLLKNEGPLLPLARDVASVAVIGPCADDVRLLLGDYSYPAHLEILYERPGGEGDASILPATQASAHAPGPYFVPMVSILDGVREAVSGSTRVRFARGCDVAGDSTDGFAEALDAARGAEVAVVCVGGKSGLTPSSTSGEFRDAADLGLTGAQQALVEAVVGTGRPTVVVLVGGRVFSVPWIAEHAPALVEAWLPGQEGGRALADVLFGAVSPAGRLPISLPRAVGQVPVYYGHKSGGGRSQMLGDYTDLPTRPLFAFGHGLGYTTFEYADLAITPPSPAADGAVEIAVDVANTGERAGDEVVQLYVRDLCASVTRPAKQLAGFARIPLEAGQVRRVRFRLDLSQLAFYDADMRFVIEPGEVSVMVGAASDDIRATGSFEITGDARVITSADLRPTEVEVA
jgi:beta-glucosidase